MFVLNAKEEGVLRHLEELGLPSYQAKAYFSCLVLGRPKAWELARYSSVPQSRIYHVLERLEDKGLVEIEGSRPKCGRGTLTVKPLPASLPFHFLSASLKLRKAPRSSPSSLA